MKPVKAIDKTMSGQYQLDLHTDYQQRLYGVISKIEPEKIFLDAADIARWHTGIESESEIAREGRASKESESIKKKDEERDEIITALFQEIRQADKSPIPTRQASGHVLRLIVDTYKGLQSERWAGKTAHINGLLNDLGKPESAAAVTAIGVGQLVTMLRTANDEFNTLRESRSSKAAGINLPSSASVRKANDQMTTDIFFHIQMAYSMATNEAERKVVGELIDQINQRIREAKATFNQSEAQRKRRDKKRRGNDPDIRLPEDEKPKKPDGPKDPKDPKDPKEPKKPEKPGGGEPPKKPDEKPKPGGDGGGPDIHLPEE